MVSDRNHEPHQKSKNYSSIQPFEILQGADQGKVGTLSSKQRCSGLLPEKGKGNEIAQHMQDSLRDATMVQPRTVSLGNFPFSQVSKPTGRPA